MKVEEEILRNDCPSSAVAEFDRMSKQDQRSMLDALQTSLQMRTMNLIQSFNSSKYTPLTAKRIKEDASVKRLLKMFPRVTLCKEVVEILQDYLSFWGEVTTSPAAKLQKYQQIVAAQKYQYTQTLSAGMGQLSTTSAAVTKRSELSTVKWDQLLKIRFSDLVLFNTKKASFVEGTIVGEPIQPMVGGTTLIQEKDSGDVLLVCFYNLLPDGISGTQAEPLLNQLLPFGATLRIREPFLKIFGDGRRGIRVDNPNEMEVVSMTKKNTVDAAGAKEAGNKFVKKKQYMAAIDSYLSGIRSSDLVPTLLSNRAQAFIQQEDWSSALLDAAASLTIRPSCKKTWARYDLCLERIQAGKRYTSRDVLEELLKVKPISTSAYSQVDMEKAGNCKQMGNEAFKAKKLQAAIENWTLALSHSGELVRAMLSNWGLCALQYRTFGDVIAATAASIRIAANNKAIFHLSKALSFLGEYDLALLPLEWVGSTPKEFTDLRSDLYRCRTYQDLFANGIAQSLDEISGLVFGAPPCLGNWYGEVETFLSEGKGRGLRATRALDEGSVILVEWPLVAKITNANENVTMTLSDKGKIQAGSSSLIVPMVVNRLKRETVLAQILSRLSDGSTSNPLVPLSDVLMNLAMFKLLLPTHREYFVVDTCISADRVRKILDTNNHGTQYDDVVDVSKLYPGVSMMNHASTPNCTFMLSQLPQLAIVVACRPVKAGQELTMKYHTDATVESKWGIKAEK